MSAKATDSEKKMTGNATTSEQDQGGESVHRLEAQRRANRDAVAALGADPYGERVDGLITIERARAMYDAGADEGWQRVQEERKKRKKEEEMTGGTPVPLGA